MRDSGNSMRDGTIFRGGNIVALVTPFNRENNVDFNRLKGLIEFHILKQTSGILLLGTTGESPTLSENEMNNIISYSVDVANSRIPIIVGCGGNNTDQVIRRAIYCEKMNVDGLLITVPNYNKPTQEGIFRHFYSICNSVHLPIMMYNIPSRCGVNMETETIIRIYNTCHNVCAIKEANGNLDSTINLINNCNIRVYIGDDAALLPALSIGCVGVVSVISNILPDKINDIINDWMKGNYIKCKHDFFSLYNLIKIMFVETNPVPIKAIMNHLNLIDYPSVRLPLVEMKCNNIKSVINEYNKIL